MRVFHLNIYMNITMKLHHVMETLFLFVKTVQKFLVRFVLYDYSYI